MSKQGTPNSRAAKRTNKQARKLNRPPRQDRSHAEMRDQVEELEMFQRIDQELGASLDFENVLMLTMDWALRRTGAQAGMYSTLTADGTGLIPIITLGYPPGAVPYNAERPFPINEGLAGRAASTREAQIAHHKVPNDGKPPENVHKQTWLSSTVAEIALPIELRGNLLGVLNLESDNSDSFSPSDRGFLRRLTARTAIALDHARLYREAEAQADDMSALYAASRLISSSLEREDALSHAAQSIASVLRVSSVVVADYKASRGQMAVSKTYRLPTARGAVFEILPALGEDFAQPNLPEVARAITHQHAVSATILDAALSEELRALMVGRNISAMLIVPLALPLTAQISQSEVLGVAFAVEGRRPRRFTEDEIQIAEAIGGQIASALRQVKLHSDVRELETLKSDMLRMASHDLRNPLSNVMGYFDLIVGSLRELHAGEMEWEFVGHVRAALAQMRQLIDDLLTLERIESETREGWANVDLAHIVREVFASKQPEALLKKAQVMSAQGISRPVIVFGSTTQLRQAVTNLVENASKYTPDGGTIQLRLSHQAGRVTFEVQDSGYGIAKPRQSRLFSRFYRAKEAGTEHIPGTGLGLSLVKTAIERHGGEVFVTSALGEGSTFGFWLPALQG
jgi:signal transduction histidine kinase